MEKVELILSGLDERHRGITPAIASAFFEAACVCLDRHHTPPISIVLENRNETVIGELNWELTDQRMKDAWANMNETTEFGACTIGIVATEATNHLYVVRRAETRTGADYYVSMQDADPRDLEHCYRLEISGTVSDKSSIVNDRLKRKLRQAARGISNLPAIAVIVGFKVKLVKLAFLENNYELE